jgi:NACalpha-BTF3-like transcription factor
MNEIKKVVFCEDTKPPNHGAMKIHTADTKKHNSYDDEIKLIMSQTNVTRDVAAKVYMECDKDIVNAIMYIIEQE